MKRIVLAALLGGVAVFLWGAVSWMALDWHASSLRDFPDRRALMSTLHERLPESGVYHFPGFPGPTESADFMTWSREFRDGPFISLLVYHRDGYTPFRPAQFGIALVSNLVCALGVAAVLGISADRITSYRARVGVATAMGAFAAIAGPLTAWNWWQYPAQFALPMVLDPLIAWTLAGLVMAAVMTTRTRGVPARAASSTAA